MRLSAAETISLFVFSLIIKTLVPRLEMALDILPRRPGISQSHS
jgi:hypothetical protein